MKAISSAAFGDHSEGRFKQFEKPVPAKGMLSIWGILR